MSRLKFLNKTEFNKARLAEIEQEESVLKLRLHKERGSKLSGVRNILQSCADILSFKKRDIQSKKSKNKNKNNQKIKKRVRNEKKIKVKKSKKKGVEK